MRGRQQQPGLFLVLRCLFLLSFLFPLTFPSCVLGGWLSSALPTEDTPLLLFPSEAAPPDREKRPALSSSTAPAPTFFLYTCLLPRLQFGSPLLLSSSLHVKPPLTPLPHMVQTDRGKRAHNAHTHTPPCSPPRRSVDGPRNPLLLLGLGRLRLLLHPRLLRLSPAALPALGA